MPAPATVLVEPAGPGGPLVAHAVARSDTAETLGHAWLDDSALRLRLDVVATDDRPAVASALVDALARETGTRPTRWFVVAAQPGDADVATALGLAPVRELWQMRVPLPPPGAAPPSPPLPWRPFVPGQDEEAWVRVNNRAFAHHRDQGGQTIEDVVAHEALPWFDPAGFLLHEEDGVLDGFCWTKVHRDLDPPAGEIYVIGVDPPAHGRGLGKDLVVAGLEHLRASGLTEGMLYVDADNLPAVGLYRRLGFVTVSRDIEYAVAAEPG